MTPDLKAIALMALGKGNASTAAFDGLKDIGILSHDGIVDFCQEIEKAGDKAAVARITDIIGLADDSAVRAKPKVIGHIKAALEAKKTPLDNDSGIFLQMYLHCVWGISARPDEVDEPEKPKDAEEKPARKAPRKAATPAAEPIKVGAVPAEDPGVAAMPKGDGSLRASRGRPSATDRVQNEPPVSANDRPVQQTRRDPNAPPKTSLRPGAWNDPVPGEAPYVAPSPLPSLTPPVETPAVEKTTATERPRLVRREVINKPPEATKSPEAPIAPTPGASKLTIAWSVFLMGVIAVGVCCGCSYVLIQAIASAVS